MHWTQDIRAADTRIRPYIQRTPILETTGFGLDYPISLKLEHMQHTGSFKARGAFNTLLGGSVPDAGLVAASGGNHGAAVAYAAKRLGVRARVYVPKMAGPAKIALIRACGADLEVVPGAYANALEQAQAYEQQTGAMQVHAYDAAATVIGQGTCFAEWDAQGLEADTLLIAVGGGGLIAGAMAWYGGSKKIVAVEPETSSALNAALAVGRPVDVEVSGVAANALGARRIGTLCYELAQGQSDTVTSLTVSDEAISAAQNKLWKERRLLVEPAGATALAALTSGAYQPAPDERVAVLLCGGNIATDPLEALNVPS
ncbi:threonine/serine dehydratase [Phaeobacter inhibens]|uniref:threonine/serine dehydratase n=1 Tax=Phaeobacter inhibens TaxID=221822 RepID=UPI0021A65A3F|nr:threonine/serine dehydratase [Phaeobacter inhibens]UWR57829.1 threonine/serine dehydratase [Phaeobacter inhibens]